MKIARPISKLTVRPQHDHDCNKCNFIGSLDGADLYYCPVLGGDASIIVRRSSEPSDNSAWGLDWGKPPAGSPLAAAFAILARGNPPRAYRTVG